MPASPARYSGTPLAKKLGIAEGTVVVALGAPAHYPTLVAPLPRGARIVRREPATPRFVHLFTTSREQLDDALQRLRTRIAPDGIVWVSWPKRTAKVASDITEDTIRALALPLGFVDIKVCAVDETWSGLKLVIRRELRTAP
jgi:hypothetical protein